MDFISIFYCNNLAARGGAGLRASGGASAGDDGRPDAVAPLRQEVGQPRARHLPGQRALARLIHLHAGTAHLAPGECRGLLYPPTRWRCPSGSR
jgi:hypothetical protein